MKSLSRVQLFTTPWTAAYQAPPFMGFFQARVLEWGAIAFSGILGYTSIIFENDIECLTELLGTLEKLSLKSSSKDKPSTELI